MENDPSQTCLSARWPPNPTGMLRVDSQAHDVLHPRSWIVRSPRCTFLFFATSGISPLHIPADPTARLSPIGRTTDVRTAGACIKACALGSLMRHDVPGLRNFFITTTPKGPSGRSMAFDSTNNLVPGSANGFRVRDGI